MHIDLCDLFNLQGDLEWHTEAALSSLHCALFWQKAQAPASTLYTIAGLNFEPTYQEPLLEYIDISVSCIPVFVCP